MSDGTNRSTAPGPTHREARAVIDKDVRLSQSRMWELLEAYYQDATIDTWSAGDGAVPCYVTSNAVIGDVYAELIVSRLLDRLPSLSSNAPVYVVELGAGSGAFSFYCLRALQRRLAASARFRTVELRYVMTDFTSSTVEAWDEVTSLDEFRASGVLDSAVFWPERDDRLNLRRSGIDIAREDNDVFVIANYFFDSLRADAFRVMGGHLYEALYSYFNDSRQAYDAKHPFKHITSETKYRRTKLDYYASEARNAVLSRYTREYDELTFSVPISGFNVVDNLRGVFGAPVVLLASDKGFSRPEHMKTAPKPDFAQHGSISFAVNFHALTTYVEALGGRAFTTTDWVPLHTIAAVLPAARGDADRDGLDAFATTFDARLGRQDAINAMIPLQVPFSGPAAAVKTADAAGPIVDSVLAVLRATNYDPLAYARCAHHLVETIPLLHSMRQLDVRAALREVEANIYVGLAHLREPLLTLGESYCAGGWYTDAIRALERARLNLGDDPRVRKLLADAYERAGLFAEAIGCLAELLAAPAAIELPEALVHERAMLALRRQALEQRLAESRASEQRFLARPIDAAAE